jgi:hypothetical protein
MCAAHEHEREQGGEETEAMPLSGVKKPSTNGQSRTLLDGVVAYMRGEIHRNSPTLIDIEVRLSMLPPGQRENVLQQARAVVWGVGGSTDARGDKEGAKADRP